LAEASTLAEAPEVCALWLVLTPAPACPGPAEALPEAEPLAEVCATAPAVKMPAVIAAIQCFFIVIASLFHSFLCLNNWNYEVGRVLDSDAICTKNVYSGFKSI
jgi:hypothetical protein